MSFPQIVEVALGLIVIYYILGAMVSFITQIVMESLETRGTALERYLKRMAGDMTVDITSLPQVKALRPIRYANWWNVFGAGTEEKKVEKIPVETLLDAFFDLSGLTSKGSMNADELTSLIGKLPESEAKQAMLNWIHQGVTTLSDLRSRTGAYFAGMLNQAALTFRAKARSVVIVLSIVVTLLFGTDSIQLARDLWTDAGLRSIAAQQATVAAGQQSSPSQFNNLLDQLNLLSLRVGWWNMPRTALPSSTSDWLGYVLMKLVGLGITATAVSQGSSFWYDLLKRIAGAPSAGSADSANAIGAVG
jgi:hypothetical protein